jgi:hypothetical protein
VIGANDRGMVNYNWLLNHNGLVHYHYGLRVPDGSLNAPSRVGVTTGKYGRYENNQERHALYRLLPHGVSP